MRSWHHTDPKTGIILLGVDGPMPYEAWERDVRAEIVKTRPPARRIFSDRRRLYPASSVTFLERALDFLKAEAATLGPVRWAVLATDRNAVYGSARMVEILAEDTSVQIQPFVDMREALTWLLSEEELGELARLEGWIERAAGAGTSGPDTAPLGAQGS